MLYYPCAPLPPGAVISELSARIPLWGLREYPSPLTDPVRCSSLLCLPGEGLRMKPRLLSLFIFLLTGGPLASPPYAIANFLSFVPGAL